MGEYQCYDFLTIDGPLTPAEQEAVRRSCFRLWPGQTPRRVIDSWKRAGGQRRAACPAG